MSLNKMERGFLFAAVLSAAGGFSLTASADVSDFLGNWINKDSDTSGITRIVVMPAGGNHVKVRVFGKCSPTDCDWGVRPGHSYTEDPGSSDVRSITVDFNAGFAKKRITLHKSPDGLRFEALTDFTDNSGRYDYAMGGRLWHAGWGGGPGGWGGGPGGWGGGPGGPGGPGGGMGGGGMGGGPGGGMGGGMGGGPGGGMGGGGMGGGPSLGAEDCIGFNPSAVSASYAGGAWKVVQGSMWMLDYGSNSAAAHHAADVIQHYHFDQQCFVKRPNASMMYWKSGNHVPSGGTPGEDCIGLNPAHVQSQHVGGAWKVVDGSNWLLDYGSDHGAADQAVAVIQTYNLNRQCFIERPNASMQYWLSQ